MAWIFPPRTRWERLEGLFSRVVNPIIELPHTIRHFFRQVGKVIDYLPVLWSNCDWSAEPECYELLRKKLQRMEPVLRNGHLVNGERYAKQIRFALHLLDLIIADQYDHEAFQAHQAKWGEDTTWFEPFEPAKGEGDDEWYEMKSSNYPNAHTEEQQEQAGKELLDMVHKAQKTRQRHIEFLFGFLARHMPGWWD